MLPARRSEFLSSLRTASHKTLMCHSFDLNLDRWLEPYMDTILSALCSCLQQSPPEVQEVALTAVASVATVTETDFSRFYSIFMPGILEIFKNTPPQQ